MAADGASGAAGLAGWKLIGGAAGFAAGGVTLAALVVMLMTWPKNFRELAVALISTVMSGLCGGAFVILKFDLLRFVTEAKSHVEGWVALVGLLGLVFACSLPGWLIVRAAFKWMERRQDKDLAELANELRGKS